MFNWIINGYKKMMQAQQNRQIFKQDKENLKIFKKELNGHIYKCYDGEEIKFNGEIYYRDLIKTKLDEIKKEYKDYLKTYSKKYMEKVIWDWQKSYDRAVKRCHELEDKIKALEYKLYKSI